MTDYDWERIAKDRGEKIEKMRKEIARLKHIMPHTGTTCKHYKNASYVCGVEKCSCRLGESCYPEKWELKDDDRLST
jgi:hypothetical protein